MERKDFLCYNVMHFVVSFDKNGVKDAEKACSCTDKIADFFKDSYQMITAVHQEDQGNSLYRGNGEG